MVSVSCQEIKSKVAEYLAEQVSLSDLQDWLAPHAWSIGSDTDDVAASLIYSLDLRIADYDAGHQPRADFLNELAELASGALHVEPASSDAALELREFSPFEHAGSLSSGESSSSLVYST